MTRTRAVTASFRAMEDTGPLRMDTITRTELSPMATVRSGRAVATALGRGAMVIHRVEAEAIPRQAGAILHRAAVQTARAAAILRPCLRPYRSLRCPSRPYRARQSPTLKEQTGIAKVL